MSQSHSVSASPVPQVLTQEAQLTKASPALLAPWLDPLMVGGASLIVFVLFYLYVDRSSSVGQISWTAFYLAWVINNPHFMASYALLYWDKRRELLRHPKFLWAGVIVPIALIAFYAGAILAGEARLLGYSVNFMFFLVGWHYVKQIYGTVIVSSVRRGYYFSKAESWALKLNLFPVWFMSYLNGNSAIHDMLQYGVGYKTLALPHGLQIVNYGLLIISLVGVVALLFRKWVREGKLPGLTAICSFAAIYVWYLPQIYHVHFWYLIPLFHSLQYLLFVAALKKNECALLAQESHREPSQIRLAFARRFFGFGLLIFLSAGVFFQWLPEFLDETVRYDTTLFGNQLFMFLFITFINIHHYFIDNVLWRRDNPALKKYLFS